MIHEIDDVIECSRRHHGETIREIARYDSGYIKDLIKKNDKFVISETCLTELEKLTAGFRDNWTKPTKPTSNIFHNIKIYASPYQYDFGEDIENVKDINQQRLEIILK